jgi:predicted nucleic acid-binding protein
MTTSIFVDTSAWYAVMDRGDRRHAEASTFYLEHAGRDRFVTSDLVLAETWTLLTAHLGRPSALVLWEMLRDAHIPIIPIEAADIEAAWRIVQAFPDRDLSLTDSASFAVMERRGVEDVFAFDHHFLVYRYGARRQRVFTCHPS